MIEGILRVSLKELNLALTLPNGQAFRWKRLKEKDEWVGVIQEYALSLRQDESEDCIHYKVHNVDEDVKVKSEQVEVKKKANGRKKVKVESDSGNDCFHSKKSEKRENQEKITSVLHDYFNLSTSLSHLYTHWSSVDENFSLISQRFPGVRILRQHPVENLFSFICSSNNNISRISQMVQNLCVTYGTQLCNIDGHGDLYSFPTVEKLAKDGVEQKLRQLGFGYRAKFIHQTAKMIVEKSLHSNKWESPEEWLMSLRALSYEESHNELTQLSGVGAKVADCVCLMSLDHHEAIPVDTHVWQISCKKYLPHLKKNKTITSKTYKEIGDFFRQRFGSEAGWAQTILFTADLRQFSTNEKKNEKDDEK